MAVLSTALAPSFTEDAVANGETRTLYLYHTHTREQIAAAYLVNGRYDQEVLNQLNWFLRDWRRDEPTTMDPRLFDVVWEAYRQAGASEPVQVVSAYRSPETNAMLRRRSRAVAKFSQHMLGKAMDTTMPGMSMSQIREIGMRMQRGGVGYYPTAGTPFVHLDVGSVRSWPRMSYEQLVRLFPDGKTVHLPSNNQPLARYDEARAEIEARGGASAPVERKSKSFLAFLFGGGGEDDEDGAIAAPPPTARKQWASLAPRETRVAADADEEGAGAAPPEKPGRRGRPEKFAEAERNLPRGETTLRSGPSDVKSAPPERTAVGVAPTQPERERSAPVALAALEPAAENSSAANFSVGLPLPPRRPAHLWAWDAPLPPARPTELASLAVAPAGLKAKGAGGAIASLIDVTGTTPRDAGLRGSAPAEASSAKPEPLLAYAPAVAAQTFVKGAPSEPAAANPRLFAATKPPIAKPVVQRIEFVPARLDRSNFQAMTAATPTSRISAGSTLGSTIGAPRSAARAEQSLFAAAPQSSYVSAFAPTADVLPTDRFIAAP